MMKTKILLAGATLAALALSGCGKKEEAPASDTAPAAEAPAEAAPADASTAGDDRTLPGNTTMRATGTNAGDEGEGEGEKPRTETPNP